MKSAFEKLRIPLSRTVSVVGVVFLCFTSSYWEANNEIIEIILFMIGVTLVAVASLGRMWCSLYIAGYKDKELITRGPYSLSRNPLYFFSSIGIIGIGFASETLTFPFIFMILFSLYYPFIIKREEKRLEQIFGTAFNDYKDKVPSFFPRLASFEEATQYTVNTIVYRKHIFSALWFIWIVGILEIVEGLKEIGLFGSFGTLY